MTRRSSKTKRSPEASIAKQTQALAHSIGVPAEQRTDLVIVDVKNVTEADGRHLARSKQAFTVRRLSRLERLYATKTIDLRQLRVCEWYADTFEKALGARRIVADYGATISGCNGNFDFLASTPEEERARDDFKYARMAVPPMFQTLFEGVVLDGMNLTQAGNGLFMDTGKASRSMKLAAAFRMTADLLYGQIGGEVSIAA